MEYEIRIKKKLGNFNLDSRIEGQSNRIGLLGASGCGKSMTLKCIAGIERPDEGYIRIGDRVLYDSENKICLKPQERDCGYLFQSYALFPNMTVEENIGAGLRGSKDELQEKIRNMLELFRISELKDRYPRQLSGGQQQRVALSRILVRNPQVILLDEPFSALDVFLRDQLQLEMQELLKDYKGLVIMVSHSRDEIYRFGEDVVIMDGGSCIRSGSVSEVFADPGSSQAAILTGCKNIIEAERSDEHSLFLPDYDTILRMKGCVPEEVRQIGIRAHYLKPVFTEDSAMDESGICGRLRVEMVSCVRMPFEDHYYLKPYGQKNCSAEKQLRYFAGEEIRGRLAEGGFPEYLEIPEKAVMYLK